MSAGIRAGSSNDGYVQGNGNDIITALSGGNVGIGVSSPSTKLHVNGTITATNFAGSGGITTDDWIVHAGDTDTKLGFPAADQIQFDTAGTNYLKLHRYSSVNFVEVGSGAHISLAANGANSRGIMIGDGNASSTGQLFLQAGGGSSGFGGGIRLYSHANSTNAGGVYIGKSLNSSGSIIFGNGGTTPSHEYLKITSTGKSLFKSQGANAVWISLLDNDSSNEIWRVGQASDGDGYVEVLEDGGTVGCKLDASGNSFTMGNFGIGVASPNTALEVKGDITVSNTNNQGDIFFGEHGDIADSKALIRMDQLSSTAGELQFHTEGGGTLTKRLTITSGGNVTVAANSDIRFENGTWTGEVAGKIQHNSNNLYIQGGSGGIRFRHHSNGANHFSITNGGNFEASTGDIVFGASNKGIHFPNSVSLKQNVSNLYANLASGNNNIEFQSNGTSFVKFRGTNGNVEIVDGDLVISTGGHGIDFSAQTHAPASGATNTHEVLDHYEEGTWTPYMDTNGSGLLSASYTKQTGTYTRIGRLVYIMFDMVVSNTPSGNAGYPIIIGLPFTPTVGQNTQGGYPIPQFRDSSAMPVDARLYNSSYGHNQMNAIWIQYQNSSGVIQQPAGGTWWSSGRCQGEMVYYTD